MTILQLDYDTDSTTQTNCKTCMPKFDTYKFKDNKSSPNLKQQFNEALFTPNKLSEASIFDDIKVINGAGEQVLLSNLWLHKPVVLKVLSRLECGFCKAEARDLSDLKPYLDQLDVGLAAVAFEDTDLKTFISSGYWEWDIFIDPERNVYKAANLHRKTFKQLMSELAELRNIKLLKYLSGKGISNGFKGDLRQLGGTFVINTDGKIIYQFRPCHTTISPDLKELYEIVGGNVNDLDQRDFLTYKFSITQEQNELLSKSRFNLSKLLKKIGLCNSNKNK